MECNNCGAEIELSSDIEACINPDMFLCLACMLADDDDCIPPVMRRANEYHSFSEHPEVAA